MSRLFEALENSADGAFVVDENLRILYCNKTAETILGFDYETIVGNFCYQLLRGHDDGRHLVCKARCQVAKMILGAKPVPNYDIQIRTNYGVKRWFNMSVFTYRIGAAGEKKVIVHLFHDLNHKKINEKLLAEMFGVPNLFQDTPPNCETGKEPLLRSLTPREGEILSLLAKGQGTLNIAKLLSISPNTVRNHIQHILEKLQVHNRLEAVAVRIKNDVEC